MTSYSEYVSLFSQTWSKQSYGLLDYEAKDLNSQKLKIRASVILQRKYNRLMISERRKEGRGRREKEGGRKGDGSRWEKEGKGRRMDELWKEEEKEDQRSSEEEEKEEEEGDEEGEMEDEKEERREEMEREKREEEEVRKGKEGDGREEEGRMREKEEVEVERNEKEMTKKLTGEEENLCKIVKVEESFFLGPWKEGLKLGFEGLWMVLGHKNYKREDDYNLNERDVFKTGRMTFKVLTVKTKFQLP